MNERETLIRRLMSLYGIRADKTGDLLNALQDHGRVSSNCVTLDDVPLCDLENAYAIKFRAK